jgi:DNA-binding beta-propeller fold protein YncE
VEYVTALTGGKTDSGNDWLSFPAVAATDAQGNLYVLELSNRISKYDKEGNLVTRWGSYGTGDSQFDFKYAGDLAIDPGGNIIVSDFGNHKIKKFDSNGKFLTQWVTRTGRSGCGTQRRGKEYIPCMGIRASRSASPLARMGRGWRLLPKKTSAYSFCNWTI